MIRRLTTTSVTTIALLIASISFGHANERTYGVEFTAVPDDNQGFSIGGDFGRIIENAAAVFSKKTNAQTVRSRAVREKSGIAVKTALGMWFFHEDCGALEIASPVFTISSLTAGSDAAREVDALFETFNEVGLKPEIGIGGVHGGGGHIHIGREPFIDNPLYLRNFVVFLRTTGIISDIYGELGDSAAAPPYESFTNDSLKHYQDSIRDIDSEFKKQFSGKRSDRVSLVETVWTLSGKRLWGYQNAIAKVGPLDRLGPAHIVGTETATDFRFGNLLVTTEQARHGPATLEVRTFRAPQSRLEVLRRVQLLDRLITYVRSLPSDYLVPNEFQERSMNEQFEDFQKTLQILGLKSSDYRDDIKNSVFRLGRFGSTEMRIKSMAAYGLISEDTITLELSSKSTSAPILEIRTRRVDARESQIRITPQFRRTNTRSPVWTANITIPVRSLENSPTDTLDMGKNYILPGMLITDKTSSNDIRHYAFKLGNFVKVGPYAQPPEMHPTKHSSLCEALFALPTH